MKIAAIIGCTLMGLMLLFAYIVVLFKIDMRPQPPMSDDAKVLNQGLALYLLPIVKVIELVCCLAFISGRFVTLATFVILPILLNIVLFRAFLAPIGMPVVVALLLCNLFLAYYYRKNYVSLFAVK